MAKKFEQGIETRSSQNNKILKRGVMKNSFRLKIMSNYLIDEVRFSESGRYIRVYYRDVAKKCSVTLTVKLNQKAMR